MNFYKKAIFIFLLMLFFMIVFVKLAEPVIEKQFSNIFSDKKLSIKLKEELMTSTEEFTPEKREFYKNVLKKLYIKWNQLMDESLVEAKNELKNN